MIKVIDNALRGVKFKDLGIGTTFKCGDAYFIIAGTYEAVNLSNGEFESFEDDDFVIPFNCELIVL